MKALYHFIVKIPKAVKDTIKVGDQEMYLDSKWNEFQNRVSSAEIVAVPEKYNTGAQPGDLLYFHHNVVLGGNHMDGNDGKELKETKGNLLFISFAMAIITQLIFIMFYSLRSSFK